MKELMRVEEPVYDLVPIMPAEQARKQLLQLQAFVKVYLFVDVDYGKQPGTNKDALFKSGAEKLCEIYGFQPKYSFLGEYCKEDWDRTPALFDYTIQCTIIRRDGTVAGTGLGSCNSYEKKYKTRKSDRECPACGKNAIGQSKPEWGGGYYCNAKKDGCGAKWRMNKPEKGKSPDDEEVAVAKMIEAQECGEVPNPDIASCKNTVLKMAKKRALVDATIAASRSSGLFTQDIGDDELDKATPDKPTKAQWENLMSEAERYGASRDEVKAFCKAKQADGHSMTEILQMAATYFFGAGKEEPSPWDDVIDVESESDLKSRFHDAIREDSE